MIQGAGANLIESQSILLYFWAQINRIGSHQTSASKLEINLQMANAFGAQILSAQVVNVNWAVFKRVSVFHYTHMVRSICLRKNHGIIITSCKVGFLVQAARRTKIIKDPYLPSQRKTHLHPDMIIMIYHDLSWYSAQVLSSTKTSLTSCRLLEWPLRHSTCL